MYANDFYVIINAFTLHNKAYNYKSWYYKSRSRFLLQTILIKCYVILPLSIIILKYNQSIMTIEILWYSVSILLKCVLIEYLIINNTNNMFIIKIIILIFNII